MSVIRALIIIFFCSLLFTCSRSFITLSEAIVSAADLQEKKSADIRFNDTSAGPPPKKPEKKNKTDAEEQVSVEKPIKYENFDMKTFYGESFNCRFLIAEFSWNV